MPKISPDTKRQRMELVYYQLERHPNGLTEREIADLTNIGQRTVNNYLRRLEVEGKIYKDDHSALWFALPYQRTRLRRFELSPEEAMTLYLAARLLVKQHDKRNESAETALIKLAEVLTGDVGVGHEIHQAALELAHRPGDEGYSRVFRTIMQGYIYRRQVSLVYAPLSGSSFETRFSPYLLEPSAIGYATYAIGHSSIVDDLRTYKLERIRQASLTRQEYAIPPDFPGLDYLRHAWSIISGESTVAVKLRFRAGNAAQRIQESQWHPSQNIDDDPENPGGCIWAAHIADLTDFIPWVRSWGADVEVLEPEGLREKLVQETQKMALLYKVGNVTLPPLYRRLWAKTDQVHKTDQTHALVFHMLDVAQVVLALWDRALPEATRSYFARALAMKPEAARGWLGFIAALHDLGKACPAFQGRHPPCKRALADELSFPDIGNVKTPHGWVSALALLDLLPRQLGMARPVARQLTYAIGGHHGAFPSTKALDALGPARRGGEDWEAVRLDLFETLAGLFSVRDLPPWPAEMADDPAIWTLLAGLVSFADWIGSIEKYFFRLDAPDLPTYAGRAYQRAVSALSDLGWTGYAPPTESPDFDALFGFSPRPLQEAAMELADQLPTPALVIVEAPTGEGKTEAALCLADAWLRRVQQRGLYVAMPTQATSNQMLRRVRRYLAKRYPDEQTNLLLLHGNAAWSEELDELRLAAVDEESESTVVAHSWFLLNKKRGLLAPFAVGTVDQALLSVLQTKHFFVRLFGLSHKTVVFDEVHAYDTYMATLLQHLLRWLAAMDTTVILLSATLPAQTRRELIKAYTGRDPDLTVPYPAMIWATSDAKGVLPLETSATSARSLALEWVAGQPATLVKELREALIEGGCVAIICNTVGQAQEFYNLLAGEHLVPEDDLILFHARFPFAWRQEIEDRVLTRFGKDAANRPERAIVVATQVIEQSLDLDFDLMVSQMAPVDLLLQRAGRLHRHVRDWRPTPLSTPRFWIILPEVQATLPRWGNDAKIYAPYVLLRSYLALRERETLTVPDDVPSLIAAVYDDPDTLPLVADPALAQALTEAYAEMLADMDRQAHQADRNLIAWPDDEDVFSARNRQLDEDNPELHEAWRALTRLTRPSVTLVCLHRQTNGRVTVEPEGQTMVDLTRKPNRQLTNHLVQHAATLSDYRVVKHFLAQEPPEGWREHALLRYYRVAIFENGRCECTDTWLTLDRHRGLIIEKKEDV